MNKAWGFDFIVVNDVRQPLDTLSKTKKGKPYIHLATVKRGLKEYIAYLDEAKNRVWIEELDPKEPTLLRKIEDDNEWTDLRDFMWNAGLLIIDTRKEFKATESYISTQ